MIKMHLCLFQSMTEMAKGILEATFTHSKNLACFVFVYKTLTNLMAWFETHEKQYQSFIAAFIGGYFVFGKYNKVNEQVCKKNAYEIKRYLSPLKCSLYFQIQIHFTNDKIISFIVNRQIGWNNFITYCTVSIMKNFRSQLIIITNSWKDLRGYY